MRRRVRAARPDARALPGVRRGLPPLRAGVRRSARQPGLNRSTGARCPVPAPVGLLPRERCGLRRAFPGRGRPRRRRTPPRGRRRCAGSCRRAPS
ncbi:hypothetical protein [Ornithinimicrobium kibberense]|uniref:hypothetical protein n=1 Tax=Ornithinimicrobium kibberense TaxID=282060 RepID=UPI00361FFFC0